MMIFSLNERKKLSKADLLHASALLDKGGVLVIPTDTSYGLAARVDRPAAVKKVFALKGRSAEKSVSMVVSSQTQANLYGVISCKPKALWKAFLPGPMTLVVWSRKKKLPFLRREDGTIAIRQVPTPVVNQLLRATGVPLTVTSANRSGKDDVYSLEAFQTQYKNGTLPVGFIDAGRLKKRPPSTVVRAKKGEPVEVLRRGPISQKKIFDVIEQK